MNKPSTMSLPSLFDYLPTAIQDNFVKEFIDSHGEALVSFMVNRAHHSQKLEMLGTGFFCYSPDPTTVRIVTAEHTLREFEEGNFGYISVGKKLIPIGDIGTRRLYKESDVGFWDLPSNFFLSRGVKHIPALPLYDSREASEIFSPTLSFIIFGYPWTRNKEIDIRAGADANRALFGMALHGFDYDAKNNDILFHYDFRKIKTEEWASPMSTAPHLKGMSGCPVIRIIFHKELRQLAFCLSGVFTDWDKPKRKLRAFQFGDPWLEGSSEGNNAQETTRSDVP